MVGRLVSLWDGLFSGAMLVSRRVHPLKHPKTNSLHLKNRPFAPKGKNRIPTIHVSKAKLAVSFREYSYLSLLVAVFLPDVCFVDISAW